MITNLKIKEGVCHKVPKDLKESLVKSQDLVSVWNNLTPLARNEWICWVASVKKEETRGKHITRACQEISSGKKRPCCWPGCSHRK